MKLAAFAFGVFVLAIAVGSACGGQSANDGLTQPIQISGGQFISGPLPGMPPPDAGQSSSGDAGADSGGGDSGAPTLAPLSVTLATFTDAFLVAGIAGTGVSGLVTSDAVAVGVALENQGTGYWVIPTKGQDVTSPGQSDFGFSASFNRADTPGNTAIRVVAISASGTAGAQVNAPICIESRVPDNGHACESLRPVPRAVFTLQWDTAFDLDLTVITPSGRNVNPKSAVTTASLPESGPFEYPVEPNESVGLFDPLAGVIDRDSMGECVVDGWHEEDLVFQDFPATGTYLIYADPFEACGQESVRFNMTIWLPGSDGNLHASFTQSGELLASQVTGGVPADGGTVAGLFVAMKAFE